MKPTTTEKPGKAAKPTTTNAKPEGQAEAGRESATTTPNGGKATPFTSAGISSLLQSEFAAAEEPETTENEVQVADGETNNSDRQSPDRQSPDQGTEETETETEPTAEDAEHTEEETEQAEGETEEAEAETVPDALNQAIAQWEADGSGELPPALQGLFDRSLGKRLGKLKTQAETAEARVQQLERELEEVRAGAPNAGVATAMDERTLGRLEQTARRLLKDARNFLEDTATDEERARVERFMSSERLDEKGLRRHVGDLQDWLGEVVPEQKKALATFRQQEQAFEPEAKKFFPWLFDKASPEYQQAQEVLRVMPELPKKTPAHRFALGIYVLGLKEFEKLKATGGAAAATGAVKKLPAKPPVKAPAAQAAAPTRPNGTSKERQEASVRQRFEKAPSRESVEELLKLGLRS